MNKSIFKKHVWFTAIILLMIGMSLLVQCAEYLYPIALLELGDQQLLYVLHQRSFDNPELWLWNPVTKIARKATLSVYNPAGLQIIGGNKGFSFVDNGRIRFKMFNTSTFDTIVPDKPLYNISVHHWLNDSICYLSALYRENYGIFLATQQGHIEPLVLQPNFDYKDPAICNNSLFYIEQSIADVDTPSASYRILKKKISRSTPHETSMTIDHATQELVNDCGARPAAFLRMISEQEGFFIEHPALIYTHHSMIPCAYQHLVGGRQGWEKRTLFDFHIPAHLAFPEHDGCLSESLLPLMPKYHEGAILFCDSRGFEDDSLSVIRRKAVSLDVYVYLMHRNITLKLSHARPGEFFFAPIVVGRTIYYGGTVQEEGEAEEPDISFLRNRNLEWHFDLPSVDLDIVLSFS
jgi:hypothetical protein